MLVAAAQTFVSANVAENGNSIRRLLKSAAQQGARLITYCEGSLSGYPKTHLKSAEEWALFDWAAQAAELRKISALCRELDVYAVVGAACRLSDGLPPFNSLFVFGPDGALVTRYDKRLLSHGERLGWYSPGQEPIVFEIDNLRFGCTVCIEVQFPEVFAEYEKLGTDVILHASSEIPPFFEVALQAHGGFCCQWILASASLDQEKPSRSGLVCPNGSWLTRGPSGGEEGFALALIDKKDPDFEVALYKARPWRAKVREGG